MPSCQLALGKISRQQDSMAWEQGSWTYEFPEDSSHLGQDTHTGGTQTNK